MNDDIVFAMPGEIERCLATLSKMYEKKGQTQLQNIIVNSRTRLQVASENNNWDGVTYGHGLYLTVPAPIFPGSVKEKTGIEISILEDINKIHHVQDEYIESVHLEMDSQTDPDWRQQSGVQISYKRIISASTTDRIWGPEGYYRVFLTHKAEAKKETAILKTQLKVYGISAFVAHEDIEPTKEWQTEIENALHSMDALVALLTDNFHDSNWTDQEVGFAFGRNVPIVPIKMGKDPYGFMGKFQACSCTWDTAAKEIAKILIKQDGMLNAYIKAVQDCGNWEAGNTLSVLFPLIDNMSGKQVSDLVSAYNSNFNVSGSFGFNGIHSHTFGNGLLPHLIRWTGKNYRFSPDGKIVS